MLGKIAGYAGKWIRARFGCFLLLLAVCILCGMLSLRLEVRSLVPHSANLSGLMALRRPPQPSRTTAAMPGLSVHKQEHERDLPDDAEDTTNKTWAVEPSGGSGKNPKQLDFVLFTTWITSDYKRAIYDTTLRMWPRISPRIETLLFCDEEKERERARSFGWLTQPVPYTVCNGTPVLREMFYSAMRARPDAPLIGFSNGDLLFDKGLEDTIKTLVHHPLITRKPVLLIVCRYNFRFSRSYNVTDLSQVQGMKVQARQVGDGSSDAFFTNRLFPWHHIPDIAVGRLGVAMWLVATARALNITVIDLTQTATAIHLTSVAGNHESHSYPTARCNHDLYSKDGLRPNSWVCGYISCAEHRTVHNVVNNTTKGLRVVNKAEANITINKNCFNCRFPVHKVLKYNFPNNRTAVATVAGADGGPKGG